MDRQHQTGLEFMGLAQGPPDRSAPRFTALESPGFSQAPRSSDLYSAVSQLEGGSWKRLLLSALRTRDDPSCLSGSCEDLARWTLTRDGCCHQARPLVHPESPVKRPGPELVSDSAASTRPPPWPVLLQLWTPSGQQFRSFTSSVCLVQAAIRDLPSQGDGKVLLSLSHTHTHLTHTLMQFLGPQRQLEWRPLRADVRAQETGVRVSREGAVRLRAAQGRRSQ